MLRPRERPLAVAERSDVSHLPVITKRRCVNCIRLKKDLQLLSRGPAAAARQRKNQCRGLRSVSKMASNSSSPALQTGLRSDFAWAGAVSSSHDAIHPEHGASDEAAEEPRASRPTRNVSLQPQTRPPSGPGPPLRPCRREERLLTAIKVPPSTRA